MTHPWWKTFLSYFKEISLEQTSSPWNPVLEILLVKGRHQVATEDAIYSYDDKYENFAQAYKEINLDNLPGKRVLLLGLGLGSVIYILEKLHAKKYDYVAVEVDQEICRLANDYTLKQLDSYVEVIPREAMAFLSTDENTYDMIIMDIFQSAIIPKNFQNTAYLYDLKSRLNQGGLLLYNRMNISKEDKRQNAAFVKSLTEVFPDYSQVEIATNIVYVSDKGYLAG